MIGHFCIIKHIFYTLKELYNICPFAQKNANVVEGRMDTFRIRLLSVIYLELTRLSGIYSSKDDLYLVGQ